MTATPTSIDFFASIIILIILVISGFALLGTGVLMAIGAVFSRRPLVTSWPVDQEQRFNSFERRGASASSLAWILSLLGAALVMVIAVGIYFGVTPDRRDVAKDMNMSNLTKRRPAAPKPDAPAPAEAPRPDTPAPQAGAPAEAPPKADTPAPAAAPKQ
jgi:hypothetical protein